MSKSMTGYFFLLFIGLALLLLDQISGGGDLLTSFIWRTALEQNENYSGVNNDEFRTASSDVISKHRFTFPLFSNQSHKIYELMLFANTKLLTFEISSHNSNTQNANTHITHTHILAT